MNTIITLSEWQTGIIQGKPITSWMGTPVIMPVSFGTVRRETVQDGKRVTLVFPEWDLPGTCVLRFNRAKRIVETEIVGLDVSIKEFLGWSDWKISLEGLLIPNSRTNFGYDDEAVKRLRLLDELDCKIPIYNPICEFLGIYEVVVNEIDLSGVSGNGQPFSLSMSSDKKVNLIVE